MCTDGSDDTVDTMSSQQDSADNHAWYDPHLDRMLIEQVWVARQPGDGVQTTEAEWSEMQAYQVNDGRSETRTTFYPEDAGRTIRSSALDMAGSTVSSGDVDQDTYEKYERLARWNDGQYAPDRSVQNDDADKRRFARTAAGHIGLTAHQADRTVYVVDRLEPDVYRAGDRTVEMVVLATLSLVVDEDRAPDPETWTVSDWVVNDDQFQGLMDDIEMGMRDLWQIRHTLVSETEHFGPSMGPSPE